MLEAPVREPLNRCVVEGLETRVMRMVGSAIGKRARSCLCAPVRVVPSGRCTRSAPLAPTRRALRRESMTQPVQVRERNGRGRPRRMLHEAPVPDLREAPPPLHHLNGCSTYEGTRERAALIRSHFVLRFPLLFTR